MKLLSVFDKTLRERLRDYWLLILELSLAPLFVVIYFLMMGGGSTAYTVLVLDQDQSAASAAVREALREVRYSDGKPMLKLGEVSARAAAEARLKQRAGAALIIIPPGFSRSIASAAADSGTVPVAFTLVGDLTNPYYSVAAVLAGSAIEGYVQSVTHQPRRVEWREESLGASSARSEFELYVPGLLIFSVTLLIFSTAMMTAREAEWGTLQRLYLSRMTSLDFLGGIGAVQVLIGGVIVVITLLTAIALGFHSEGPLWAALVLGGMTTVPIIGIGLLVAAVSTSEMDAFLYGNFPLFLLMFFSGAIFPMPKMDLVQVAGRGFGPADLLPPTHAVVALNKILTHGEGMAAIGGELLALLILSVIYVALGVWLFQKRQLKMA